MKEFEKWDMQEYPLPSTIERGPIGRDCLQQRKRAWEAALEWVKSEIFEHHEALDVIEEELNGDRDGNTE